MAQKEEGGRIIRPHFINKDNHPQEDESSSKWFLPERNDSSAVWSSRRYFAIVNQFIETDINGS